MSAAPYDVGGSGIVDATEQGWDGSRIPIRVDDVATPGNLPQRDFS